MAMTTSQFVKVVGEIWDSLLQTLALTSISNDCSYRQKERERYRRERGGERSINSRLFLVQIYKNKAALTKNSIYS